MKMRLIAASLLTMFICQQAVAQDSAVINFTAELKEGGYSGVPALDPFTEGTPTFNLANVDDSFGLGFQSSQDYLKFNGQIVISDFRGDGTYLIGGDNGEAGGVYLVSPLLNRVEAVSLRTEGAITQASADLGFGRSDGNPSQNRDDIYLPDFSPNGVAAVTVLGNQVSLNYLLDFNTLPDTNAQFLRGGDTDTEISDVLAAANAQFEHIGFLGKGVATPDVQAKGPSASTPFGAYDELDPLVSGNLSNTNVDTTLQILNLEFDAMNISTTGRCSDPEEECEFVDRSGDLAPFFADEGDLYFFDLTDDAVHAFVSTTPVPLPAGAWLMISGLLGLVGAARRRQAKANS
ncbi:MAG: VPLPA-CTERM sorting domain-containing protein [Pseudomonadota bacterium]